MNDTDTCTDTKKQPLQQPPPPLSSLKKGNIVTIAWEQNDVENIDGFHILQEGTFVSINRVGTIVDFAHDKIIICWSFVSRGDHSTGLPEGRCSF